MLHFHIFFLLKNLKFKRRPEVLFMWKTGFKLAFYLLHREHYEIAEKVRTFLGLDNQEVMTDAADDSSQDDDASADDEEEEDTADDFEQIDKSEIVEEMQGSGEASTTDDKAL